MRGQATLEKCVDDFVYNKENEVKYFFIVIRGDSLAQAVRSGLERRQR
jgi:hypothetical protein